MSEGAREGPRGRAHLRCPFCHDALDAAGLERVACAGCGAPHHASCFVEGGECAATGCGSHVVRIAERELSVEQLAAASRDLAGPGPAPPMTGRLVLWGVIAAVVLFNVTFTAHRFGTAVTLGLTTLGLALATLALAGLFFTPRRRNARDPRRERELLASIGVLAPEPLRLPPELLDPDRRPPRHAGPPPERCPSCRSPLADGAAGVEDEEEAWFCHHCGASLAPEPSEQAKET